MQKIKQINDNMKNYLSSDVFDDLGECFIYVERQIGNDIRKGLIVAIDLEKYDYNIGAKTLMRATERTVIERLKVRKKIRQNATIDLPHIMVLINDKKDLLFNKISNCVAHTVLGYDVVADINYKSVGADIIRPIVGANFMSPIGVS